MLGIFLVLVAIYPFVEAWVTGDKREHHIADRPRNAPTRTAIGAAGVTFYAVLWAAASSDLIATHFRLSIEGVIHGIQAMLILGPVHRLLRGEADLHRPAEEGPRDRAARLRVRSYRAAARAASTSRSTSSSSDYERWKLVSFDDYEPLMIRPNKRGRITVTQRVRAVLSRWFFEDRITPVTQRRARAAAQPPLGQAGPQFRLVGDEPDVWSAVRLPDPVAERAAGRLLRRGVAQDAPVDADS